MESIFLFNGQPNIWKYFLENDFHLPTEHLKNKFKNHLFSWKTFSVGNIFFRTKHTLYDLLSQLWTSTDVSLPVLQVLSANIVKSGSKTFAVYSLSVTDVNNHSWSIKRRSHYVTFCFYHYCECQTPPYPEYYLNISYYPVCDLLLLLFVTGFVILRSYTDVLRSIMSTIFICHPNIFSLQVWMFKSFKNDANFLTNIWRWCSNRWHLEVFLTITFWSITESRYL